MTFLCVGALLVGVISSRPVPFLPFACALMIAMVLGSASRIIGGSGVAETGLGAIAILSMTQVGYGLGLLVAASMKQMTEVIRRTAKVKQEADRVRDLRTKNGSH